MNLLAFALVALGVVLTPGPNMMYLVSRTLSQGRMAGLISYGGVVAGLVLYLALTVFGITAMLMAVPIAYDVLRFSGAAYLLFLAWQSVKPGGKAVFQVRDLKPDTPWRLFSMGFLTSTLNPKVAVLFLSLLPQFIVPSQGHVVTQLLTLGAIQICISATINCSIVFVAAHLAAFLGTHPTWLKVQRYFMGGVLSLLAVKLIAEHKA
jgi:threonine/homoserine/homoserine lactone efflux protein